MVFQVNQEMGKEEEEKILLSDIIQRINEVFGENLGEEDRITLEQIQQRMNSHDELKKVIHGNNSEDVKKEYFDNLMKDTLLNIMEKDKSSIRM